jgi:ABC-type methionine transport system ATPase subunit
MYQLGALFGGKTLLENVRLPLEEFTDLPDDVMDDVARAKLGLVGLGAHALKQPSEISGGMQKRAAIARALALDPPIIFLDEPSAGLDPVTSADLDAMIEALNRMLGTTFVIISHELASIFAIGQRFAMLDGARNNLTSATSLWESWFASDDTYSHNHGMFASVDTYAFQALAGIQPHQQAQGQRAVGCAVARGPAAQQRLAQWGQQLGQQRVGRLLFGETAQHEAGHRDRSGRRQHADQAARLQPGKAHGSDVIRRCTAAPSAGSRQVVAQRS